MVMRPGRRRHIVDGGASPNLAMIFDWPICYMPGRPARRASIAIRVVALELGDEARHQGASRQRGGSALSSSWLIVAFARNL